MEEEDYLEDDEEVPIWTVTNLEADYTCPHCGDISSHPYYGPNPERKTYTIRPCKGCGKDMKTYSVLIIQPKTKTDWSEKEALSHADILMEVLSLEPGEIFDIGGKEIKKQGESHAEIPKHALDEIIERYIEQRCKSNDIESEGEQSSTRWIKTLK